MAPPNLPMIIHYNCPTGFKRIGAGTINCLNDGSWNGVHPIVRQVPVPPLTRRGWSVVQVHGTATSVRQIQYNGTTVTYSCADGYEVVGAKTLECTHEASGRRRRHPASKPCKLAESTTPAARCMCEQRALTPTSSPPRPTVSPQLTSPLLEPVSDSSLWTTRNGGFLMKVRRNQRAGGRCWSLYARNVARAQREGAGVADGCHLGKYNATTAGQLVPCEDPGPVKGGSALVEKTAHGRFLEGSRISYYCKELHYLSGEGRLTCTANGTWSAQKHRCIPAHCVTYEVSRVVIPREILRVALGKHFRSDSKDDAHVQVRKVAEIHVHFNYGPTTYDNDIALVQLDKAVELTPRVRPVCLPTDRSARVHLQEGKLGVATGWGLTETGEYADVLSEAMLPVVANEKCQEAYERAGVPLTVSEAMFCAGHANATSNTCTGDSGSPMVFLDDAVTTERRWILEGVVSWGSPYGCAVANQYSGLTRVFTFLPWIKQFI
ncbi:hypothetical protein HPB52_013356 [Rhipicephalus sanguineus]|uniref:Uncharacterized protein n=1 Tax=Rhipicephalus sanguineus TaxID=34632 RepID=A0A9D4YQ05_RHISA|nr:hypothetical protein HPB52_013356 [Rhipicephalus sanguineus]